MIGDMASRMKANLNIGRSLAGAACAGVIAVLAAGCVGDQQQTQVRAEAAEMVSVMPRNASYDCGDSGSIVVEAATDAVRLTEADGSSYDLPASPPSQASRFGTDGLALVVEEGEALWMKAGKEPVTCR